jgi:hypothetical protein
MAAPARDPGVTAHAVILGGPHPSIVFFNLILTTYIRQPMTMAGPLASKAARIRLKGLECP